MLYGTTTMLTLVFILHGYNSNSEDMKILGDEILMSNKNAHVCIPDAFEKISPNGYSWFHLEDDLSQTDPTEIDIASEKLKNKIDAEIANYSKSTGVQLDYKNIVLIGFSQGAALAIYTGLKYGVGKVVSCSGFIVKRLCSNNKKPLTKVLVIQGGRDELITKDYVQKLSTELERLNVSWEYYEQPNMQHEINRNCVLKLISFLNTD